MNSTMHIGPTGNGEPEMHTTTLPGYELLDEIGKGGMGVVYRARELTLNREVAVKLLLDSHTSDSNRVRRFLDEARISAQLQHPGIPAVYQVGLTADSRPFLAMKLIKGHTLDDLLNAGTAVDGLAIFAAISQAVGYAHAHGVIHRDLKPQNIMVGAFGEIQVMDWGLAKVLGDGVGAWPQSDPEATGALTEIQTDRDSSTPVTQYGVALGTPAYMAPEQAAGELEKIDARADVFGLGAILCVILTGLPPYEGRDAEKVRIAAVRGEMTAALARLDGCTAHPEVVALCKSCLAFDPNARPVSADAVACAVATLRQAADERARQAERDKLSAVIRAAEQAKRRRSVQLAAGAVAAVLLVGVSATSIGLYQANEGRKAALAAQRDADDKRLTANRARDAEAEQRLHADLTLRFFEEKVFSAIRPEGQDGGLGPDVKLRAVIDAALPYVQNSFSATPLVEVRLLRTLGTCYWYLGEVEKAESLYRRAAAILAERYSAEHPDVLRCAYQLANSLRDRGSYEEAVSLYHSTLNRMKVVFGDDATDSIWCQTNLAACLFAMGNFTQSLEIAEQALQRAQSKFGPDHPDTLWCMSNVANALDAGGSRDAARSLRQVVLTGRINRLGKEHPDTLWSMANLAGSLMAAGDYVEARRLDEEVFRIRQAKLGSDHPSTLSSMYYLAISCFALGEHAEALKLREHVFGARKRVLGADHPDTLTSMQSVAESLIELNRAIEAIPILDACAAQARGKPVEAKLIPTVLNLRLRHFRQVNDPMGCRSTATMWEGIGRHDADSRLNIARCWAAASTAQVKMAKGATTKLAEEDADKAMEWLVKAVAAGLKDRAFLDTSTELDVLRERGAFQKLRNSLPEPSKVPVPSQRP